VNLFKLASAAVAMRPGRRVILSETGNFPTDLYMLQGLCRQLGGAVELKCVPRDRIAEALDDTVAVLVLTHVHYTSGEMFDMAALTARAHAVGALTLWDLSHSTGAVPVDLTGDRADLAVGCGYKYLNGGPGAPAFAYVAHRHQAGLSQPLSGWMGHAAPFAFVDAYQPAEGIGRMLCGTPSVLAMTALDCGLATFDGVEMTEVRAKSMSLSSLFLDQLDARLPGVFELVSPRSAKDRGSHVSLAHPDGYPIMAALIEAGVIGDFRAPDRLRFGFTPLYLSHTDVFDAVETLAKIMHTESWRAPRFAVRQAVT
jgi:kynureninase